MVAFGVSKLTPYSWWEHNITVQHALFNCMDVTKMYVAMRPTDIIYHCPPSHSRSSLPLVAHSSRSRGRRRVHHHHRGLPKKEGQGAKMMKTKTITFILQKRRSLILFNFGL